MKRVKLMCFFAFSVALFLTIMASYSDNEEEKDWDEVNSFVDAIIFLQSIYSNAEIMHARNLQFFLNT